MKGLFSDPIFDEDLWDFVISGMHKIRDKLERDRVEKDALMCCVHNGELMMWHCNKWVVLPSIRRRKEIV